MLVSSANYAIIFGAALARFLVGWIWYSVLFAKHNQGGMKEMKREMKKSHLPRLMILNFLASVVLSFVMCHFVYITDVVMFREGFMLGVIAWLGFSAVTHFDAILWEGQSWKIFLVKNGYDLITFAIMGGILAQWA